MKKLNINAVSKNIKKNNVINGTCKVIQPLKTMLNKLDNFLAQPDDDTKEIRKEDKEARKNLNRIRTGYSNPVTHTLNLNK